MTVSFQLDLKYQCLWKALLDPDKFLASPWARVAGLIIILNYWFLPLDSKLRSQGSGAVMFAPAWLELR